MCAIRSTARVGCSSFDHFNAGDAHEDPRRVGDLDCIEFFARVGHALVRIDFAWLERKEGVVDLRCEVAWINHGVVWRVLSQPQRLNQGRKYDQQ